MENSVTSRNKVPSSSNNGKATEDSPEESSWTFYMQDFLCDHDHDNTRSFSYTNSYENSPSLVSDAFSSAAKKAPDHIETAVLTSARSNCKNSSFKRRKAKATAVLNDHLDLEDTASSPVNSPKVSYINQLSHNQNEKDNINVSEANICRNISTAVVVDTAEEENNNNQSDLKKRGLLCLVSVSMLTNFFG